MSGSSGKSSLTAGVGDAGAIGGRRNGASSFTLGDDLGDAEDRGDRADRGDFADSGEPESDGPNLVVGYTNASSREMIGSNLAQIFSSIASTNFSIAVSLSSECPVI